MTLTQVSWTRRTIPRGCYSSDAFNLEAGDPSDLEDWEIIDCSRPSEPMDQSDTLGHGVQPTGDLARNASAVLGGMSDFQSEDMDTTAQPSEAESHSDIPTTNQDARSHQVGPPDSAWGEGESETSQCHRQYPTIPPHLVSGGEMVENRWYEGEYIMDPREVVPLLAGYRDLTFMDPMAGTRVTSCPLAGQIGNTSITTVSCSKELSTLVTKGMRRVSARPSLNRNVLSMQRAKTKNVQVMNTGKRCLRIANTSPLPRTAW